jgi:hypothetical protein
MIGFTSKVLWEGRWGVIKIEPVAPIDNDVGVGDPFPSRPPVDLCPFHFRISAAG